MDLGQRSDVLKLLLDLLLLGDELLYVESVWDLIKDVRSESPENLQICLPVGVNTRSANERKVREVR